MAQILINIPDFLYEQILKKHVSKATIARTFQNGAVLPKGHGRIADVDKILDEMRATRTYDILFALERVKPILEADKGGEE